MSSLLGNPGDRWPLARAVDALIDSARGAGIPGPIWMVGIFYPSLNLNVDLVRSLLGAIGHATGIEIPGGGVGAGPLVFLFAPMPKTSYLEGNVMVLLGIILLVLPLIFLVSRLIVGLAKVSDPKSSEREEVGDAGELAASQLRAPALGAAWREGKRLGPVALGMWLMLLALLLAAMLFLIGPLVMLVQLLGLTEFSWLLAGLILPVLLLLLTYAVVLQVLNQLALHSLAHNRRGIASALTHAWRLIRSSPWSAARATLVDFVLFLSILVATQVITRTIGANNLVSWLEPLVLFCLLGFAGVTRAGFWARTYRALGGLSSTDHVPGL